MIVLSTHGLTVRAYSRVLLFDVDMAIPASGVTCLMGPCAAGKSTLLRAVSWQLQGRGGFRVDGVVRYGDHRVSDGYAPAVVAQQLQQPLLTVFELIVDNLPERAVLRRAEQRELIGERLVALGCAGLAEAMDTQLIDLSLLDARRAAIVRELVADPQLICIDEPCTGLEDDAALRMMALLEQMATERPVLWVTHHQARARPREPRRAAGRRSGRRAAAGRGVLHEPPPPLRAAVRALRRLRSAFTERVARRGGRVLA